MTPDLSVVVPAYNEERRLPVTLAAVVPWLKSCQRSFELILVDDGSRDRTLEVMREWESRHPEIRVISQTPNRGKGRALASGVEASSGRLVLVSDADFSTPITEIGKLEAVIGEGADVAIGSRARRGASIESAQPLYRVLMGKTFNLMVQALVLPGVWDTQCGFKLFRGDVARDLFAALRTDGFGYDVDVLYRARRRGLRIREVPVRWINSPETKVHAVKDSLRMLGDIIRVRLRA